MKSELSPAAGADPRAFRVLIVDKEHSDGAFVERVLRQPGYETVLASDGHEAIRIAETRGPFDLLVTEVMIPGMRGDELARRLRGTDPALRILYLTENSGRLFEERTLLWEEEAFVEKPLTVQGVLEAVSLILSGHIPAPRAVRVTIPGGRARLENRVADLMTLSVTGALIRDNQQLATDTTWRIALELPSGTMHVNARVVSCTAEVAESPEATALQESYATALAFVTPSVGIRRALQRVIDDARRD